jgi:hypothetical protein
MTEKISITEKLFRESTIAQKDDEYYSESGYVAFILPDGRAALASYSHCSCYGTFESLCDGGISDYFEEGDVSPQWIGAVNELVAMAERCADPAIPTRTAIEADYDYEKLKDVYRQIIEWDANGRKLK